MYELRKRCGLIMEYLSDILRSFGYWLLEITDPQEFISCSNLDCGNMFYRKKTNKAEKYCWRCKVLRRVV